MRDLFCCCFYQFFPGLNVKMAISRPDEVLHFRNNSSIEISYRNTQTYSKCRTYDAKAMSQGMVWHQVIVQHNGKIRGKDSTNEVLDAIFDVVAGEELFPIAYRHGVREDRFLVRQCKAALDKLFAENLRIQLSNASFVQLQVQLNVGDFVYGQISPYAKISEALNHLYTCMVRLNGEDGILNLSRFASNEQFLDLVVNLGNRAVLRRVCDEIYRNDDKFRTVNGLILSNNGIVTVAPLQVFDGVQFAVLDLRENELRSSTRLCRDLKELKADALYLAGNPVTTAVNYPQCLKPILNNFKLIDGIPSENLSKDYTPMDYDVDVECDGYRLDLSNKDEIMQFQHSDDWHAVMIPDGEEAFTKEEIIDYFLITTSPSLSDIYPCYYTNANGEHRFLVRHCFDQLKYLLEMCNLEIKIPRFMATPQTATFGFGALTAQVPSEKTLSYYLRMNISPFKKGQVEPMECIEKALDRRFSAMDRLLNLENFQNIEGLDNIIINLTSPKILGRIVMQASRKYLNNCAELCLAHNKIMHPQLVKPLSLMSNLKSIDLGNNWIQDLSEIKDLQVLGLKALRLDGNPLCAKYAFAGEYIKAVCSYFPDLTKLDNVEIKKKGFLSTQKNFLCDVKGYDFVEEFVTRYFKTFESNERQCLRDLYYEKAIFTMCCSYVAPKQTAQNCKRISKYVKHSRNVLKMQKFSRATSSIHLGPDEIVQVLIALPSVTHDILTFNTDTTILNENMVAIIVSGVFLDQAPGIMDTDMLLAFRRTFVLIPVEQNLGILKDAVSYQIANEQFSVFNPTPLQTKSSFRYFRSETKPKNEEIVVADKEALLVMFQEVTSLKSIWCTRCLEDAKWDFQKALLVFLKLCDRKEVPDTAFM